MRRLMIVASVALAIGLVGQEAFAQRTQRTSSSSGRSFSAGAGASGQGSGGSFGVGSAGEVSTSDRFMRNNRQGAFVGADSGDASEFVGNTAAGTNRESNSRNIRRGGGGQANVNQGGGRGRQREEVRVVLQLGFARPNPANISSARAPAAVASRLVGRMERSSWIQNRSPLEVSIDQGTATLRGVVATEHDRALAERLALLEGGIWKVENLLQVETPPADLQEAPALLELTPESSPE